jgi:DNA ligase (NAD+)
LKSVDSSKQVPFERVLFALGIRYVGETVAKKLAYAYHSMDQLKQATLEQLMEVDEIGDRIAQSVITYFASEKNQELVKRLQAYGVQMCLAAETLTERSDKLAGKSIVISGTFNHHSRDEYKKIIEQHGGKNVGSVSGKTDFILAGENMGPAKLEKAERLGIKILNETDFLKLLEE